MKTFREDHNVASWAAVHTVSTEDQIAMTAMRAAVEPSKGKLQGAGARGFFDAIMEGVAAPSGIIYEADKIGGVPGWWCRPKDARPSQAVMHIHGGWFNFGSAQSFRHLVGHIAASAGVASFVPDYALAPEHPFPGAVADIRATYFGLVDRDFSQIAITGDSAGGNLALGLLAYLASEVDPKCDCLVGGIALSPVTDLAFSGDSWSTRAEADPLFIKPQADGLASAYLAGHDALDPFASPLYARLEGLVPVRVHVGNDEVLLDDSVRFVERAVAAGVDARLDVWEGMIHGFLGNVGRLAAATAALRLIGEFMNARFGKKQISLKEFVYGQHAEISHPLELRYSARCRETRSCRVAL